MGLQSRLRWLAVQVNRVWIGLLRDHAGRKWSLYFQVMGGYVCALAEYVGVPYLPRTRQIGALFFLAGLNAATIQGKIKHGWQIRSGVMVVIERTTRGETMRQLFLLQTPTSGKVSR